MLDDDGWCGGYESNAAVCHTENLPIIKWGAPLMELKIYVEFA